MTIPNFGLIYNGETHKCYVRKPIGCADYLPDEEHDQFQAKMIGYLNVLSHLKQTNCNQSFKLKTCYPGLLCGSGYTCQVLSDSIPKEEMYQLGLYFDHTTGLPIIPGSSLKGVLRAVFPEKISDNENDKKKKEREEIKRKYIAKLIGGDQTISISMVIELGHKIFGTSDDGQGSGIFMDAYPVSLGTKKDLFADDYITPHGDVLKDPVPIKFLKVAPGVTFQFDFILQPVTVSENEQTITLDPAKQLDIFKSILLDWGIGAKRNVNYGSFIKIEE